MRSSVLFLLLLSLFAACQSDTSSNTPSEPNPAAKKNTVLQNITPPSFEIESYKTKEEMPRSVISVTMGNRKVKVADTVGSEVIKKSDYKKHQIPAGALQACGGWWAGMGEYYYLIEKGAGNYVVLKGSVEEEQEGDSYGYKEVMNINQKDGITPM